MVRFFKTATPASFILLICYGIAIHLNLFIDPPAVELSASAPLSNWLLQLISLISNGSAYVLSSIFLVLLFIQAFFFNFLVEQNKIFDSLNILTAFSYLLLAALFNEALYLSPAFFAAFPILFAFNKLIRSYNDLGVSAIFDGAFALGIASLFYLPSIVLLFFYLIGLSVTRVFSIKEWILGIIGMLIPYFLLGTYFFWNDQLIEFVQGHFLNWNIGVSIAQPTLLEVGAKIGVLALVIGMGLMIYQRNFLKVVVRIRKYQTLFVYLLSVSFLSFIFINKIHLAPIAPLLIPAAYFLAYSFYETQRQRIYESMHLVLLLIIISFQYGLLI